MLQNCYRTKKAATYVAAFQQEGGREEEKEGLHQLSADFESFLDRPVLDDFGVGFGDLHG
jgi:hypothetical protein